MREEGRKEEARKMLAHKAGFKVVCDLLGAEFSTVTLEEFAAFRDNPKLKGDKRVRARFNSAMYMIRKHADSLADPPAKSIPTISEVLERIDRLRPLFGRGRYRNRAYKTVARTFDDAAGELRRRLRLCEAQGEDASGWTISQLQAYAGSRKGLAKVKRAAGLLSGEVDDAGMPILGEKPKVGERKPPAKPAARPVPAGRVKSAPPPPTVAEVPAKAPAGPDEVKPAAGGLGELPAYDESLSLEDNYRRLHRAYVEVDSGLEKARKKVDGLVEVIKQLSDLVR